MYIFIKYIYWRQTFFFKTGTWPCFRFSVSACKIPFNIRKYYRIREAFLWFTENQISFFLYFWLIPFPYVRYLSFHLKIYLSGYFPPDVDGTVGPAASSRIVVSPQEPLTEALSGPKGALFKHGATQTRLSHSCGAGGALNLSQTPPPTPPPCPGGTPPW